MVVSTSLLAASAGRPNRLAASSVASASRNTEAGPLPDVAVTESISVSSSIPTVPPALDSSACACSRPAASTAGVANRPVTPRSEEQTSELQSLMRISYAVFCLKKQNTTTHNKDEQHTRHAHPYDKKRTTPITTHNQHVV